MKKTGLIVIALLFVTVTTVIAGGDQNQYRHDGAKGKGTVTQNRHNK